MEKTAIKFTTKKRFKFRFSVSQLFLHLSMAVLLFCMVYPLIMSVWCAFKTTQEFEVSKFYPTLPFKITNLYTAFTRVWGYMYNTVAVAIFGITGSLFIASLASYAFAKMEFPGKSLFFTMVLCLMMIPGVLTLVPQVLLYRSLRLNNTLIAILLPQLSMSSVGAVFLLTMFFKGLPKDLFNAAKIDGATDFQIYMRVAVPLCAAILITQAIQQINSLWNDYIWPMTIITDYTKLTISAGLLVEFSDLYSQNMPVTYSGYLIASLPLLAVFIFGNKFYIQGLIGSSIKM